MPEQLFLWLPVLPLPFLSEKNKHKYYKLLLLATNETNDLWRVVLLSFLCALVREAVNAKKVVTIFPSTEAKQKPEPAIQYQIEKGNYFPWFGALQLQI